MFGLQRSVLNYVVPRTFRVFKSVQGIQELSQVPIWVCYIFLTPGVVSVTPAARKAHHGAGPMSVDQRIAAAAQKESACSRAGHPIGARKTAAAAVTPLAPKAAAAAGGKSGVMHRGAPSCCPNSNPKPKPQTQAPCTETRLLAAAPHLQRLAFSRAVHELTGMEIECR